MITLSCPKCHCFDLAPGPYGGSFYCPNCDEVIELYQVTWNHVGGVFEQTAINQTPREVLAPQNIPNL